MGHFFQVTLRTLDVEAARDFYARVLGEQVLHIVRLHEQALAKGARPHWLGYLEVDDVTRAAAAFSERGAQALAPKWVNPEGLEAAVMRDPGGALIALAKPPPQPNATKYGPALSWYTLHTNDVERAKANYRELVGLQFHAPIRLAETWTVHPFSWQAGSEPAGWMSDIAGRPHVHPHWLFHFHVPALEPAIATARACGAAVMEPFILPNNARIAICDDPQGAAFALQAQG